MASVHSVLIYDYNIMHAHLKQTLYHSALPILNPYLNKRKTTHFLCSLLNSSSPRVELTHIIKSGSEWGRLNFHPIIINKCLLCEHIYFDLGCSKETNILLSVYLKQKSLFYFPSIPTYYSWHMTFILIEYKFIVLWHYNIFVCLYKQEG